MIKIILFLFLFFVLIEILLSKIVNFLRNYYDNSHEWIKNRYITNIITQDKDFFPEIKKDSLSKFKVYMHDKNLGSIYKSNTSVIEKYFDGSKLIRSKYIIQNDGSRFNKLYKKKNYISTYGDSLTFCRYVQDNQTWQYYLSKKTKTNIKNFGVGNYGLDQSYLRYIKNKHDKAKVVIFAVGPETIRRNLSLWKHYYEFGNIFYFKPAYLLDKKGKIKKKKLKLKNISIKTDLFKIHNKIKTEDFFYNEKFCKYVWKKPYLFSLLKNPYRKISLILFFSLKYLEIEKKNKFIKKINNNLFNELNFLGGLKFDFVDRLKYFKNKKYYQNTLELIKIIKKDLKRRNKKGLLVIIPAHYDYVYRKKLNSNYYEKFIKECKEHIDCLDLGENIKNIKKNIFADRGFGGHFNDTGNKIISKVIYNHLKKNNYF